MLSYKVTLVITSINLFLVLASLIMGRLRTKRGTVKVEGKRFLHIMNYWPAMICYPYLAYMITAYVQRHAFMVNAFPKPLSVQLFGIVIFALGILIYVSSIFSLGKNWSVALDVKEGQEVVNTGWYQYIRHPIYSALILMMFGIGFLALSYLVTACAALNLVYYYFRAKNEQNFLSANLNGYPEYMKKSKMFVPLIF